MSLTNEQVLKILCAKHGVEKPTLKWHETTRNADVDGMMGEYYTLICISLIDGVNEQEDRFFVKRQGPVPNDGYNLSQMVFNKEVANYKLFLEIDSPILNSVIPKCYLAEEENLVLSDLALEGYKQQDVTKETTLEEIKSLLTTLAALHAASIIYEEQKSEVLGRPYRLTEDYGEALEEIYFSKNFQATDFVKSLVKMLQVQADIYGLPETLKNGKNFKEEMERLTKAVDYIQDTTSSAHRHVVCHCDLWAGNIFRRSNGDGVVDNVKLIDFQITRYKPPALDVVSALYLHTTRAFRKSHYEELLKFYFDQFARHLIQNGVDAATICKWQDFKQSCQEARCMAVFNECNTMHLVLLSKEDLNHFVTSEDRVQLYVEDRSPIVHRYKRSAFYDLRCSDAVYDLLDLLEDGLV